MSRKKTNVLKRHFIKEVKEIELQENRIKSKTYKKKIRICLRQFKLFPVTISIDNAKSLKKQIQDVLLEIFPYKPELIAIKAQCQNEHGPNNSIISCY